VRSTHLASLVLGDLVHGVLAALLALAVGLPSLGNVDLERKSAGSAIVPHFRTTVRPPP
jgi:hypothetical protein